MNQPVQMIKNVELDTKEMILEGVNTLADAVSSTLGPAGRTVMIEVLNAPPVLTKDGVSVAEQIHLEDPIANMACQVLKQAARRTNDQSGDGTTTSTVLAQTILNEALSGLDSRNPNSVKRGIEAATAHVIAELEEMKTPVQTDQEILNVAYISANGDEETAQLILQAIQAAGADGVITVESSSASTSSLSVVEGMEIDRGMLNQNFVTSTKNTAVLDSPYVLVVDQKVTNNLLVPILEKVHATGRPLLLISSEIEDNALKTMLVNKLKGAMETCAIKSPGFGTARQDYLADLAVLTGATVISDLTVGLKDVELGHLGTAVKTTSSFHNTVIQGEAKHKKNILIRINEIRDKVEHTSGFEKESHQRRIAALSGGIAVIYVGGSSETEQKELLDRVEDSLNASRAAIASGIVPGGGVALINCNDSLLQFIMDEISNEEEKFGAICVMIALRSPLEAILRNAGQPEDIVQQIIDSSDPALGYDAKNNQFGDMYSFGIIDPVQVTSSALQNAASVSAQLLLTDVSVTIKRQDNNNNQ